MVQAATATATPRSAAQRGAGRTAVPTFALYGEALPSGPAELLHVETIASRSRSAHWEIATHVHQGLVQVLWLTAGSVALMLDEVAVQAEGPCAVLVPPGVVHGFRFSPEADGVVFTTSPRFLLDGEGEHARGAFQDLFSAAGVVRFADPDGAGRLDGLLRTLLVEFNAPGGGEGPVVRWLARSVVWRLAQARERAPQADDGRGWRHQALYARFLVLVEAHVLEHWTLQRYASRLGLSVARLNRLVRAEAGTSALDVIHERLTREACRRLAYIAAPASSLAAELGFDDPAYFCRFFKRRTGLTPQRWRQAHQPMAG